MITNHTENETTLPTARALRRGTAAAAAAIFLLTVAATWLVSPGEARAAAATVTCAPAGDAFSKKTRRKAQEATATGDDARVADAGTATKKARKKKAGKKSGKKALKGVLNLNTATAAQLRMLPGIGEAKAARIIAWRKANGPFPRVVDLRRVKGFGKKTVDRLADYLTVEGKTTLRQE